MRIVIALGGNALLRRSDPMTTEIQRRNIRIAAQAIAPLAAGHSIVIAHGNGPQVGLLSLQAEAFTGAEPYPLDVLDAGTQGMIGYLIQQELRNLLPPGQQVATLLTMITVDPADPAFAHPTKFVGPVYAKADADKLAAAKGWAFRQDGTAWRRVVPSPQPRQILEIEPITWLLDRGAVVICAGGGGIPTVHPSAEPAGPGRRRSGHRQGPGQRTAGQGRGRGPVRHGHRRGRGLPALGHPAAAAAGPGDPGGTGRLRIRRGIHGPEGRGRGPLRGQPAGGRRSARSQTSPGSSRGQPART